MTKIENALGKKIQISNSPASISLSEKFDPYTNLYYEQILFSIDNLLNSICRHLDVDKETVKLFSAIYGLGQLDGGISTYNYINSIIDPSKDKISELDVMFNNLIKIFPDYKERFTENELLEISQVFSSNPSLIEARLIKILYSLKVVSQYYKSIGKLDEKTSVDFIFDSISEIINQYKQTNLLSLTNSLNNIYGSIVSNRIDLDEDEKVKLNQYVGYYNQGTLTKSDFISELNNYRISKEKKTKIK